MEFEVNIRKFHLLFFFLVICLIAGYAAYAYGTNNPASFGHSGGEIEVSCGSLGTTSLQNCINRASVSQEFTNDCIGPNSCSSVIMTPPSDSATYGTWSTCFITSYLFQIDDEGSNVENDLGACNINYNSGNQQWTLSASLLEGATPSDPPGRVTCTAQCLRI